MAITSQQPFFPMCYGPEFVAKDVRGWIEAVGARTAFIEPGSPWENELMRWMPPPAGIVYHDGSIFA